MSLDGEKSSMLNATGWSKFVLPLLMVLVGVMTRWLPHPPNMTAVMALGFVAGAVVPQRWLAILVPLVALLISDLVLGFHGTMIYVYGATALITILSLGLFSGKKNSVLALGSWGFFSSGVFFVITNLGVWLQGGLYPLTKQGLIDSFVMALPFYGNQLLGDLLYASLFFAAKAFYDRRVLARSATFLQS
ncbi:MAG: hypothetical protein COT73_10520 [Bdellovibrio sp. CG10_big_fil_rev_8_21_14_0_10_47_8]|nr:MAG: hypothetical protein COT73_10520 [Bdellovibrio sp. CG10_big_fil_rev_8_21_14_0_10_47_8]